jgi:hypothetical protein
MSSRRTLITESGTLKGMDLEGKCIVIATEVRLPGSNIPPEYAKISIHKFTEVLPDGLYELSFGRYIGQIRKQGEHWAGFPIIWATSPCEFPSSIPSHGSRWGQRIGSFLGSVLRKRGQRTAPIIGATWLEAGNSALFAKSIRLPGLPTGCERPSIRSTI